MNSYYILLRRETQIGNKEYLTEREAVLDAKYIAENDGEEDEILVCKVIKMVKTIVQKPQATVEILKD